jgi:hypothetical protein
MGQLGFFDADKRLEALSAKGDPLEAIDRLVPWESFRAEVEAVVLTSDELKKSSAGRKPFDALLMFRMLVLQALKDEQVAPFLPWPRHRWPLALGRGRIPPTPSSQNPGV